MEKIKQTYTNPHLNPTHTTMKFNASFLAGCTAALSLFCSVSISQAQQGPVKVDVGKTAPNNLWKEIIKKIKIAPKKGLKY